MVSYKDVMCALPVRGKINSAVKPGCIPCANTICCDCFLLKIFQQQQTDIENNGSAYLSNKKKSTQS